LQLAQADLAQGYPETDSISLKDADDDIVTDYEDAQLSAVDDLPPIPAPDPPEPAASCIDFWLNVTSCQSLQCRLSSRRNLSNVFLCSLFGRRATKTRNSQRWMTFRLSLRQIRLSQLQVASTTAKNQSRRPNCASS
jgi:hypothetical protein